MNKSTNFLIPVLIGFILLFSGFLSTNIDHMTITHKQKVSMGYATSLSGNAEPVVVEAGTGVKAGSIIKVDLFAYEHHPVPDDVGNAAWSSYTLDLMVQNGSILDIEAQNGWKLKRPACGNFYWNDPGNTYFTSGSICAELIKLRSIETDEKLATVTIKVGYGDNLEIKTKKYNRTSFTLPGGGIKTVEYPVISFPIVDNPVNEMEGVVYQQSNNCEVIYDASPVKVGETRTVRGRFIRNGDFFQLLNQKPDWTPFLSINIYRDSSMTEEDTELDWRTVGYWDVGGFLETNDEFLIYLTCMKYDEKDPNFEVKVYFAPPPGGTIQGEIAGCASFSIPMSSEIYEGIEDKDPTVTRKKKAYPIVDNKTNDSNTSIKDQVEKNTDKPVQEVPQKVFCGPLDSNSDDLINFKDFRPFLEVKGKTCSDDPKSYSGCKAKDHDNDGDVDDTDYEYFRSLYNTGKSCKTKSITK